MSRRFAVGFVSLGCSKNMVDTETMMGLLAQENFTITGDSQKADVIVINTCGFLEPAKNESMDTIGEFVELKKKRKLKGVVVTGCMTERYLGVMSDRYPEVDAFLQTKAFSEITKIIGAIESGKTEDLERRRSLIGEVEHLQGHSEITNEAVRLSSLKRSYAYVKIAEGCNRTCSFCIIPKLRGKLHSRSVEGITEEVRGLVASGVREVVLIAQDLTSYGRDLSAGNNLAKLLLSLEGVEGLHWYRLMYNYPRFFDENLISTLAHSKKFSGYLDIPFQHASDKILKLMRRPEGVAENRALIERLRVSFPQLALRTTVMVGFPGETDADFEELLQFIKDVKFDHLGAFTFYREEGTPSYELPLQVDEKVKKDRFDRLMKAQKVIQKEKQKKKMGQTVEVLVDSLAEKTKQGLLYRGRHGGQAPEVDGVTYWISDSPLEVGDLVQIELEKVVGDYDLLGSPDKSNRQMTKKSANFHS